MGDDAGTGPPGVRNFGNRTLFHGDNLPFLRGMNSGTIDLIATDPPFNKGRDFHATPDSLARGARFQDRWSWADDVEGEWVDQLEDDWPDVLHVINGSRRSWGDDMGAFLCFMGVRLLEMRRVLKPTGSIYLHCDQTASHYLKELMDAVFGRRHFRNEIVWAYTGPGNTKRWFPRKHDNLLFYVKSNEAAFNADAVRVPYKPSFTMGGGRSLARRNKPGTDYTTGREEAFARGKIIEDYWTDIPSLSVSRERLGYPTQKPLALYERIIRASSSEGDWVLDPFAGCATTCVAAERLDRRWVGMDLWDGAHAITLDRLRAEQTMFEPESVRLVTEPPERTDGGAMATPYLQVTERYAEPADGSPRTRADMLEFLLAQHGPRCQGCDRDFDDPRYLQLDHNTPRADGGINHITNRVLLCGPCNRLKGAAYTLTGLRRENARLGYMAKGG